MNSGCTHSFDSVIQSYVFIYYLHVDNSQISVSNPHFFPRFQTHISSCLLDISTWVSNRYLKHICRKLTFHCSISHPQAPSIQPVVFSILLMAAPSFYLFRMSSHPWFLPSIPRIQSVRRSFSHTLKTSGIWQLLTTSTQVWAINPNIAYLDYCSQLSNWLLLQLYFQNGSQSDLLKICQIMIFFSICPLTSHLTHNKS